MSLYAVVDLSAAARAVGSVGNTDFGLKSIACVSLADVDPVRTMTCLHKGLISSANNDTCSTSTLIIVIGHLIVRTWLHKE